jgi:hypothetical protein
MGPLGIEFAPQPIETPLLLDRCGGRRLRGRLLEREMKALMAPILFRMAAIDAIELNAQLEPPDRQR